MDMSRITIGSSNEEALIRRIFGIRIITQHHFPSGAGFLFSSNYLAIPNIFPNFANKYRRYVVKMAQAFGPDSLSAGWRYDFRWLIIAQVLYSMMSLNLANSI